MAKTGVSKFRFVSPGIQIAEIDNSQLPQAPQPIGPVIIGNAERGPGLRPVTVSSFADFVAMYGNPSPGNTPGDIWRNGGHTLSPTYGVYAAQAWFKNNSPVTFVRLLGRANDDNTTAGRAGWEIGSTHDGTYANGGAFGLWLIDSGTVGGIKSATTSGTLAAIFYCSKGRVDLSGTVLGSGSSVGYSTTTSSVGALIKSDGTDVQFTAIVKSGSLTDTGPKVTFNFNENSKNYIRKVFNTDPTLIDPNACQYASAQRQTYVLGQTYDRDVDQYITNNGGSSARVLGVMLPLSNASNDTNVNRSSLMRASTGWVISQDNGNYASYGPLNSNIKTLFRFRSLEGGEWEQKNLKISITNIKASKNEFSPFGSFDVEVRLTKDNDGAVQLVETFSNCNLNPESSNYIAEKIGNSYTTWSDTDRRYKDFGDYPTRSKYIYVDMNSDLPAVSDNSLLPFGYRGPQRLRGWNTTGSMAAGLNQLAPNNNNFVDTANSNALIERTLYGDLSGSLEGEMSGTVQWFTGSTDAFTGSFVYPKTYLRYSTEGLEDPQDAYFGLDTTRSGSSTRLEESYVDAVRGLPGDLRGTTGPTLTPDASSADGPTEYSYVFSLDDVSRQTTITSGETAVTSSTQAYWVSGSRRAGAALSVSQSAGTLSGTYQQTLDAGFDQFTMPLFGGFDGVDIRERNPFNNSTNTTNGKTELNSYAYNSVKMAIDSCADPELVECNLMSMPGLVTNTLTDHMLNVCENRGDALAVIDIDGNFIPRSDRSSYEADDSATAVAGAVGGTAGAVTLLNNRVINNSYGVTYYPWVRIRDTQRGVGVWVPPSVVAIGTYSKAQTDSELWFAPAGFTRGGLTEGAAGLPVIGVKQRLTSKERDSLYEANINPIATFPAEGIVMFGQKTLQATPSALDRVNVRRLMIHVKKEISRMAATLLFDQNVQVTWDRFTGQVVPFLNSIRTRLGLDDYRVLLDKTTTTPDLIDRNIMYAKIYLKPARAIEFIAIDFVITNSGAAFED